MFTRLNLASFTIATLLAGFVSTTWAAEAGVIQNLSGNVSITGVDNVTRKASAKEKVQSGETIVTEAKSETLIKFADDSTVVLRPNTQFQLVDFKYTKAPATDSSLVKLLRGSARFVTGLIGKNNRDSFRVTTPTATVGIRGTDFEVAVLPEDTADARAGVYDYVRDGATNIMLTQSGQSLDVKKNQTGFAPDKLKPGEEPLQILRDTPIFLQSGGGLDAILQSITIQIPMFR